MVQKNPPSTEAQRSLLRFIQTYSATHGFPPTIREIAHGLGRKSLNGTHETITRCIRDGRLSHEPGKPRSLVVLETAREAPVTLSEEQQRINELEVEVRQLRSLLATMGAKVNRRR